MNKLKAFTILEVTVSMLIASLSIVITYTAYSIVSKSYRDYDVKNKKISELTMADKLLKRDFLSAEMITRTDDGIALQDIAGIINYEFQSNYILRDQYGLRIDTLHLAVSDLSIKFENKESADAAPVDKLNMYVRVEDQNIELAYLKWYSAGNLLNKN